jgi:hypothetical protein
VFACILTGISRQTASASKKVDGVPANYRMLIIGLWYILAVGRRV